MHPSTHNKTHVIYNCVSKKMIRGSFSMVNINFLFTWVLFIKNVNHSYCKSLPFWSNYIKLELTFKMYMCICYTSVLIQLLWSWYKRYNNHVCFGLDRNNCLCVGKKHDIFSLNHFTHSTWLRSCTRLYSVN